MAGHRKQRRLVALQTRSPAPFIVLVLATVTAHGVEGLLLVALMSGVMLSAVGLLRLGTFVKYIPYPVTVGFTAGIAIIIAASQIKDLIGLSLKHEPGSLLPKLQALATALPTASVSAILVALLTIGVIAVLRRYRPAWPTFIIAVAAATVVTAILKLPVETIGSRFGGIPQAIPLPRLPAMTMTKVVEMLPSAISFALLGAIESLLSAVVTDSMSGRRHRSNCELLAQGLANIASSLFGGICVTGNIARTATNVRSGARGPVSGMLHSVFLLAFMLLAAPLAGYVPLATLAGVLVVVAWNMAEKHEFAALLRASRGDALVLGATFLLVIFKDLTTGIVVGFAVGTLLFLHRMAQATSVEHVKPLVQEDRADTAGGRAPYDARQSTDPDIAVFRISGAFFFGAAAGVAAGLEWSGTRPRAFIVDLSAVPFLDSTGAATLQAFVRKASLQGASVYAVGASRPVRRVMLTHRLRPPRIRFAANLGEAMGAARAARDERLGTAVVDSPLKVAG